MQQMHYQHCTFTAHHSEMPNGPQPPPGFSASPLFGNFGKNTERPFDRPSHSGGIAVTEWPPVGLSGHP
ncbi:hypothetical protein ANCCAN_12590 [Ancylostoma caninum]|uniref:Uncharacterized protein n=1 Tax=Ancylostoma caninum TaxID=29170 RepID=A0A368GAT0_ANCCA|nr:hypothetical protein ANCCAN_12590 [Ancylostoma caninum]